MGALFPLGVWILWPQTFLLAAIWAAIFFVWFFLRAADWFFDAWLLTDRAVIDLEWRGVFHRLSLRISYSDIESISGETRGFWGTIFQFGTAKIGIPSGEEIRLDGIFRPKKVEFEILKRRNAAKNAGVSDEDAAAAHELLKKIIAQHLK